MTRKIRKIISALLSKGFSEHSSKHKVYYFVYEGRKTSIWTEFSHGSSELTDNLLSLVRKQLHLTKDEFEGVVECPIDGEKLTELYIGKGIIRP